MITNPVKAIRAKCLDCNYTSNEVDLCPCTDCALWPFRHGKILTGQNVLCQRNRRKQQWQD